MDTENRNQSALGRHVFSAQDRRELLEKFETSGMSTAAFCAKHGVKLSTFYGWQHRARNVGSKVALREVRVPAVADSKREVRVCLANHVSVILEVGSSEELGCVLREAARC